MSGLTRLLQLVRNRGNITSNWILATGYWNDSGVWDDNAQWID